VEFRLTYQGILLSETNRSGAIRRARADHKHELRKRFHHQLKKWWSISPYLAHPEPNRPGRTVLGRRYEQYGSEALSRRFERFGYNFVPLVLREMELQCSVEVLYLRAGRHGDVLTSAGDIDNRLKTLFDALSMPRDASQVGKYTSPEEGETPFYCLLEDDSVITQASVEADFLLEPVEGDPNDARLVVTVNIRPARVTSLNLGFG
jgi:hypothetical protein